MQGRWLNWSHKFGKLRIWIRSHSRNDLQCIHQDGVGPHTLGVYFERMRPLICKSHGVGCESCGPCDTGEAWLVRPSVWERLDLHWTSRRMRLFWQGENNFIKLSDFVLFSKQFHSQGLRICHYQRCTCRIYSEDYETKAQPDKVAPSKLVKIICVCLLKFGQINTLYLFIQFL